MKTTIASCCFAMLIAGCSNEQAEPVDVAAAIKVQLADLEQAYADNEAGAQLKYGATPVIVTGKVAKVILDADDQPLINMQSKFLLPIGAPLPQSDMESAGTLKEGDEVTVYCGKVTEMMGKPVLDDCRIHAG